MTTPPKPTRWWGYSCLCASSAWSGWLGCPGSSASSTKWKRWVWSPADLKALGPPWSFLMSQIRCGGSHFAGRTRHHNSPDLWLEKVTCCRSWPQIGKLNVFISHKHMKWSSLSPVGQGCGNYLILIQASITVSICSTECLQFWIHVNFTYVFSDGNKKEHQLPNTGFKTLDLKIHVLS